MKRKKLSLVSILKEEQGTAVAIPANVQRGRRQAAQNRGQVQTQTTQIPSQPQMVAAQQVASRYSISPQELQVLIKIQDKLDTRNSSLITLSNELGQAAPTLFGGFEDAAEQWPTEQPAPGAFDEFEEPGNPEEDAQHAQWQQMLDRRRKLSQQAAQKEISPPQRKNFSPQFTMDKTQVSQQTPQNKHRK